jgi:hypothetical protein
MWRLPNPFGEDEPFVEFYFSGGHYYDSETKPCNTVNSSSYLNLPPEKEGIFL